MSISQPNPYVSWSISLLPLLQLNRPARITGEDFDDIDTAMPILMSGPVGSPISPISTEFAGFSFIAKFSQSQAILLIPNPPQQPSYNISVSFYLTDGTQQHVLSCSVPVKGK